MQRSQRMEFKSNESDLKTNDMCKTVMLPVGAQLTKGEPSPRAHSIDVIGSHACELFQASRHSWVMTKFAQGVFSTKLRSGT